MNERRLRSRRLIDLVPKEKPYSTRSNASRSQSEAATSRKPKTESKKQKSNQNAKKILPDPANEKSNSPTIISKRSDSLESLPDAFQSASLLPKSTCVVNTIETEKPTLETIEPSSISDNMTLLDIENTKKDPAHPTPLQTTTPHPTSGSNSAAFTDELPPEELVSHPEITMKDPSAAAVADAPLQEAVDVYVGHQGESSKNPAYVTDTDQSDIEKGESSKNPAYVTNQSDIEKDSLEITDKIFSDRSLVQLTLEFDNDSDLYRLLNGPRDVALTRCEDINITDVENISITKLSLEDYKEADNEINKQNAEAEDILEDKQEKGTKRQSQTRKPKTERKKQKSYQNTNNLLPDPANEKSNSPTNISNRSDSLESLLDAFKLARVWPGATCVVNTMNTEKPTLETIEPSSISDHITLLDFGNTTKDPTHPTPPQPTPPHKTPPQTPTPHPTSGSNSAVFTDELPPQELEPSVSHPENSMKDPNAAGVTDAPLQEAVDVYVGHKGDRSKNPAYVTDESDIEKDSRSLDQLSPCFDNDSDFSGLDTTYVPSSDESTSESDHDLEIDNESLDGPHEVSFSRCGDTNATEIDNASHRKSSSEDDTEEETEINKENIAAEDIMEDKQGKGKRIRERDFCFYCETFILNFARHMVRNHTAEPEVQLALSYPKNSQQRKKKFCDLRKKGNYVSNSQTSFKPVKKCRYSEKTDYLPCSKCLGFYSKKQLWRHVKKCDNTIPTNNAQSQAQNFLVRYVKVDKNLKETVFPRMRPDKVSLVAKKDKLICMFGAQYLKTHREKHFATVVTRKMRELAKLLVEVTKLKPNISTFEQLLKPQYYDTLVHATKVVARFNEVTQQFGAPTYAMNIATSIKQCCSIALLQSCKVEATIDTATVQADLKTLSKLIEENWKFDISSQAADDLNVKKWNKTTIVPLATDLKLFKDYLSGISWQSSDTLTREKSTNAFNNLVESTYCRVLLLNRRRPGELQRVKLSDYNDHGNDGNKYEEFDKVLSSTEKILVDKLKRIVIRGKRSRPVPVLFTTEIQNDIKKILSVRDMYVGSENNLLFVKAGGITVCGYKVLEKYAKACGAKNYKALTSTRLRKHLATMTQLFAMNETELEQLATFMGHTLSVHKNNYRLPSDVYQTAKISKLLLLMEDGKADMYQGKALDEIDLDMDEEINGIEIENQEVMDIELEEEGSLPNEEAGSSQNYGEGSSQNNKQPPLNELTNKSSTKKKRTLIPWTAEQKKVVTKHFKEHIKHKRPPKRAECDELKNKYPALLNNKDWLKIKVYIQNIYSKR